MLVVISDLHLTDGSSGETINSGAFKVFRDELARAVKHACWRKNVNGEGHFEKVEQCDLLLLGDVFDVIRSVRWREDPDLKPWSDCSSEPFLNLVEEITDTVLQKNAEGLAVLKSLTDGIDVSDDCDNPILVPVRIHYMVGNHDWFYHLPSGEVTDRVRQKIIDATGISQPSNKPFPHTLTEVEGEALYQSCLDHQLYAQHGDVYDPINFDRDQGRDFSSLGDAIVVMLLNAFPSAVRDELELSNDHPLFAGLKEIDNVRPLSEIPNWVHGTLKHYAEDEQQYSEAIKIWNRCADDFLKEKFVRSYDKPWRPDIVDLLQMGLKLSERVSLRVLGRFADLFKSFEESYAEHALKEPWLADGKARFVIYGHTHDAELVPIDEVDGVDQIYFNSGTWRRVHRRCEKHRNQYEYAKYHIMTFVAFYKDGERFGRPYESWTGQLGS